MYIIKFALCVKCVLKLFPANIPNLSCKFYIFCAYVKFKTRTSPEEERQLFPLLRFVDGHKMSKGWMCSFPNPGHCFSITMTVSLILTFVKLTLLNNRLFLLAVGMRPLGVSHKLGGSHFIFHHHIYLFSFYIIS